SQLRFVMKLGKTDPVSSPSIAGMQTRTGGRPPKFFDEELRVMQLWNGERSRLDRVVATIVQWNTHPESMESKNTEITSDFPAAVRKSLEAKYGGTAIYISGDLGAVEIVGDTNNKRSDRIKFDGKEFPLNPAANRPAYTFERTEAIGRDIAKAAIEALDRGEWNSLAGIALKKATLRAPMDNQAYLFLAGKGVLDTMPAPQPGARVEIETNVYAITIGSARIITTPGELFPEVFYGVQAN